MEASAAEFMDDCAAFVCEIEATITYMDRTLRCDQVEGSMPWSEISDAITQSALRLAEKYRFLFCAFMPSPPSLSKERNGLRHVMQFAGYVETAMRTADEKTAKLKNSRRHLPGE